MEIFPVPFRWVYYMAKEVYKCKGKNEYMRKQDHWDYYELVRQLTLDYKEAEQE